MCYFSIIIPVYNAEFYLRQCISSVLSQSYSNFEVLLVDDGSTDSSRLICQQYADTDARIRILSHPNAGAAVARNTGISAASGVYVLFLDSDDWWCSDHVLEQIFSRLSITAPDVLSFNFQKYYSTDRSVSPPYFNCETLSTNTSENRRLSEMAENELWISSPCNKVIRCSLLHENNLYFRPGITAEDIDWCMRVAIAAERFDYIDNSIFFYRQHSDSASHNSSFSKVECLLNNILFCINLAHGHDTSSLKKQFLLRYISYQFGTLLYVIAALPNTKSQLQLVQKAKPYLSLLSFSVNPKIKLLRDSTRLIGLRKTLFLLRIIQKFRR